jgi:hypothetical protein
MSDKKSNSAEQQTTEARVWPTLNLELKLHEAVTDYKGSSEDRMMSFYVRAVPYRRLLHFVADRVLGNPERAALALDNCLYSAAQHVMTFDCKGAFRSWLVRLVIDEALAILHGRTIPCHQQVYFAAVTNHADLSGYLTSDSTEFIGSSSRTEKGFKDGGQCDLIRKDLCSSQP